VVGSLNGVRMVEGGWQARLGYGRSKSKQSLGTYSTGKLHLCSCNCPVAIYVSALSNMSVANAQFMQQQQLAASAKYS